MLSLPTELIIQILKLCTYKSVSNVSQTCRRLREICHSEEIWKFYCMKDYGIMKEGKDYNSFGDLYKNLLHRYGHLLGTYVLGLPILGGLAEIVFQDDCLWVWHLQVDPCLNRPPKNVLLFKIEKGSAGGSARLYCCSVCAGDVHYALLKKSQRGRRFVLQCGRPAVHHEEKSGYEFRNIFVNRNRSIEDVLATEAIYITSLIDGLEFFPLKIPDRCDIPECLMENGTLPESLVEPGLFRPIYNFGSGVDTFLLSSYFVLEYKNDSKLSFSRVSKEDLEDPKKKMRILLYKALIPFEETDYDYYHALLPMVPRGSYERVDPRSLREQDFLVHFSEPVMPGCDALVRGKCKARFRGFSGISFSDAQPIDFVVFDKDVVGVLWLQHGELSLFAREKKTFTENRGAAIYINT